MPSKAAGSRRGLCTYIHVGKKEKAKLADFAGCMLLRNLSTYIHVSKSTAAKLTEPLEAIKAL